MILLYIVLATFLGGLLSVIVAASLTVTVLTRVVRDLVSLSAGVLLGTALLNVLPEAFESTASPQSLFTTLLAGLLFFFLLEKAELYRHQHHHEGDEHHHHHGFDRQQAGRGGWTVLMGDSILLLNAGLSRRKALLYNAASGLAAVAGGVLGYFVVGPWKLLFPYLLVIASSSFIYVAVADLIPQLQHRLSGRDTAVQLAWL